MSADPGLIGSLNHLNLQSNPTPSLPPVLRQRKSQRFTIQTQSPPVAPPMPLPPGLANANTPILSSRTLSTESATSSDSSNSNPFPSPRAQHLPPLNISLPPSSFAQTSQQQLPSPPTSGSMSGGTVQPRSRHGTSGSTSSIPWQRNALPSHWLNETAPSPTTMPNGDPFGIPSPSNIGFSSGSGPPSGVPGHDFDDDEVIPTAIVVKNIPFSVRREVILAIMDDLHLTPPYAFNYHYDTGIFRGLAFANFRQPAEADAALVALNGYDLQGRRLRVEYKRVLRAGEKERIERDKAIKRMRSAIGLQGTGSRREGSVSGIDDVDDYGQVLPASSFAPPIPPVPVPPVSSAFANVGMAQIGSSPSDSGMSGSGSGYGSGSNERPKSMGPFALPPQSTPSAGSSSDRAKHDLDLNDPPTLEIFSRVLVFKDDTLRDELAFARSLTPQQRRVVHLAAQKLGLEHHSVGEGEDRHVVVFKGLPKPTLRHAQSAYGNDTSTSLRSKKSAPDLRYAPLATTAPVPPLPTNAYALSARRSNNDLRTTFGGGAMNRRAQNASSPATSHPSRDPFYGHFHHQAAVSIPPVPVLPNHFGPIGSQMPLHHEPPVSGFVDASATVVRQPRGPDDFKSFIGRSKPSREDFQSQTRTSLDES